MKISYIYLCNKALKWSENYNCGACVQILATENRACTNHLMKYMGQTYENLGLTLKMILNESKTFDLKFAFWDIV